MPYRDHFKRVLDFVAAAFLLFASAIPMLVVALCIKLTSKGPVFFRQQRGARGGTYFTLLKFRTMAEDPDAEKRGFEPGSGQRVTPLGRILRKTKLDELPQLINVLCGDMSLVGPRPEVKPYIDLYPEQWKQILEVRPGITDPASIRYRNEEEILAQSPDPEKEYRERILPDKLAVYRQYVETITFCNDIRILFKTAVAVLFHH